MSPGDTLETAIWVDGNETPAQWQQFKADVLEQMTAEVAASGYAISPLRWRTKKPGDERVPARPPHVDGPDVRLLVGEATVMPALSSNFLADLEPKDLTLLRGITRRAYARQYPAQPPLSDRQADTLINDLGPDAAVAALERGLATIQ